ncbi:MAG TPA: discoidin domain-containing protein [Clostridia bacterium]|nr:discoidin domain-containing protein [Clostridia bacterium]
MKRWIVAACCLLGAVTLVCAGIGVWYTLHANEMVLIANRVTVPAQETAQTPERFVPEEMAVFVPPTGENLAKGAKLTESGHTDVYIGKKAIDGRNTTYWEGDAFPASLTLQFESEVTISQIAFTLPPLRAWSARTQTVQIETSSDGEQFTALPTETLSFDPMTGNACLISIDPVTAGLLRITFLSNTGATGGQVSELMLFS